VKKPLILGLFAKRKKTQTFSPITLIVIKTFVPSTPSINHQKPKTKKPQWKTGQNNQNSKTFSFLHSDPVRFYQLGKKKERKKKEIKNK
jgi:hypothetical protein